VLELLLKASKLLPHLPSTVDPKTLTMSPSPKSTGPKKRMGEIADVVLGKTGLA